MNEQRDLEANTATKPSGQFIRAVGQSVRSYKLGDLLVASNLINSHQLKDALALQKQSRDPLGKILVRQGYLSAVQLYRKLAEQWCLKASAAGVTLMMQVMAPSIARADDNAVSQVRLASAFAPTAIKPTLPGLAHPRLFGSTEIKSNDISAFTKWTTVMRRFEGQMSTQASSPRVQMWKNAMADLRGKSAAEQLQGVDSYINGVRYVEDSANYGKSDYWATPIEFFSKGGDCEDYAIAKYASLRALGYSADQMRIAIVQDKIKHVPHAILIVYTEEGAYVLDNQDKRVRTVEVVDRYRPIFSLNSTNWWLHKQA